MTLYREVWRKSFGGGGVFLLLHFLLSFLPSLSTPGPLRYLHHCTEDLGVEREDGEAILRKGEWGLRFCILGFVFGRMGEGVFFGLCIEL